jgi:ribulose-5-phosphate 4-epimerase/fuculose-1-phosphate aldolase
MSTAQNPSDLPVRSQVTDAEWKIRVDLAAAYRLVAYYDWDDMIFTHISARVPGPEHHFLINPYGLLFDEITASNLVKTDLEGQPVLDTPYATNPAGFTIHGAIHEAREDAQCVLHLHTLDGSAVSAMAEGLLPLNQTALLVRGAVAYHDFEGVALDHDERPRLLADMGDKDAMILRNHGTLTIGNSVAEAFIKMYFLERACSMQVRALSGGRPLHLPTAEVIEKTAEQGRAGLPIIGDALAWPALLRMLDRIDPSFRD